MIFKECECGESYIVSYECGDPKGYTRKDCKCGRILMIERSSVGDTTVLKDEKEFDEFCKMKKLVKVY